MSKLFEKEYDLRTSDFDKFNHIKPSSILDLFQDAAGRHAGLIGVGFEEMKSRSFFWVLIKTKFQILSQPALHQRVKVKTWPLAPNKFIYRREYCVQDEKGETLIIGSTEWVVMHSEKRRLVSAPDLYTIKDGFCEKRNFEERLERVDEFETHSFPYTLTPGFSEIDSNGHVNNTKYANFLLDSISPQESFAIDVFQIDYKKEVMQGTTLHIYNEEKDGEILFKGLNDNNDVMFTCKIKCKGK